MDDLSPNPSPQAERGVAVLFDLDGVIVDSRAHHMAAWEAWGRVHAPQADAAYWHRSFGLRNDAIIGALMPGIDADDMQALADEKERMFRERARGNIVALPGVVGLIDALDARGVPRAVVTSTPRENLDMILDAIGLTGRFGALVAAEDTTHGKPHPEGFLLGATRLGVPPERCIVIEDAPHGLEAARAAGMRAIAVTTTHPAAELRALADVVVDALDDAAVLDQLAIYPSRSVGTSKTPSAMTVFRGALRWLAGIREVELSEGESIIRQSYAARSGILPTTGRLVLTTHRLAFRPSGLRLMSLADVSDVTIPLDDVIEIERQSRVRGLWSPLPGLAPWTVLESGGETFTFQTAERERWIEEVIRAAEGTAPIGGVTPS